jgi:hypothetical protein
LGPEERRYTFVNLQADHHVTVCVEIVLNKTLTPNAFCTNPVINHSEGLDILVGILAGLIFLIPCVIFITYIFFKDRAMTERARLEGKKEDDECLLRVIEALPEDHKHNNSTTTETKTNRMNTQGENLEEALMVRTAYQNPGHAIQPHAIAIQLAGSENITLLPAEMSVKTPQGQSRKPATARDTFLDPEAVLVQLQRYAQQGYDLQESTL